MASNPEKKTHELGCPWIFYYDCGMKNKNWEENIFRIGEFETVEDFWCHWNNLPFYQFPSYCNLRCFKKHVNPDYEDPLNREGGKYVVRMSTKNKKERINTWMKFTLETIGRETGKSNINGVVLGVRPKFDQVQIWVQKKDDEGINERFLPYLPRENPQMWYSSHFNENGEVLSPVSGKKKKKRKRKRRRKKKKKRNRESALEEEIRSKTKNIQIKIDSDEPENHRSEHEEEEEGKKIDLSRQVVVIEQPQNSLRVPIIDAPSPPEENLDAIDEKIKEIETSEETGKSKISVLPIDTSFIPRRYQTARRGLMKKIVVLIVGIMVVCAIIAVTLFFV